MGEGGGAVQVIRIYSLDYDLSDRVRVSPNDTLCVLHHHPSRSTWVLLRQMMMIRKSGN
jgi:hypothetical protein